MRPLRWRIASLTGAHLSAQHVTTVMDTHSLVRPCLTSQCVRLAYRGGLDASERDRLFNWYMGVRDVSHCCDIVCMCGCAPQGWADRSVRRCTEPSQTPTFST